MRPKKNYENRYWEDVKSKKEDRKAAVSSKMNRHLKDGNGRQESSRTLGSEELELISDHKEDQGALHSDLMQQQAGRDQESGRHEYPAADRYEKQKEERWDYSDMIRRRAEQARDSRGRAAYKREILFDIIIDGTYSFTKVFPKIYYIIEDMLEMIRVEKAEYKGALIKYGLTVLHAEAEPCVFDNGEYFTESEKEFLRSITNIEFYGGSPDGRENLKDALNSGLCVLNNHGREDASRGLLLFSDSIPKEEDLEPDFSQYDQDGYLNKGLRFAMFYTNNNRFMPRLKIVDRNGDTVERGKNEVYYNSLWNLLSLNETELKERIQHVVVSMLSQTSVMG